MRILYLAHELPPRILGGTGIYTWNVAKALAKGHEVSVFSRIDDPELPELFSFTERRDNVTIRYINRTNTDWFPFENSYVNRDIEALFLEFLDEVRPEVVHFQHIIYLSIGLLDIVRSRGIKTLFTVHDFWLMCPMGQRLCSTDSTICDPIDFSKCGPCTFGSGWKDVQQHPDYVSFGTSASRKNTLLARYRRHYAKRFAETPGRFARRPRAMFRAIQRTLGEVAVQSDLEELDQFDNPFERRFHEFRRRLRRLDLVMAPSEFVRDQFIEHFRLSPSTTIFCANGMDFSLVNRLPKTTSNRIRIGFVGAVMRTKGLDLLVDAFCEAALTHPNLELHVHGACNRFDVKYFDDAKAKGAAHPASDRIHFHGRFDNRRIGEILAGIDVLVVPSIWYENAPLTLNEAAMTGTPVITADRGGMLEFVRANSYGRTFELGNAGSLAKVFRELAEDPTSVRLLAGDMPRIKTVRDNAAELVAIYSSLLDGTYHAPSPELQAANRGGDVFTPSL